MHKTYWLGLLLLVLLAAGCAGGGPDSTELSVQVLGNGNVDPYKEGQHALGEGAWPVEAIPDQGWVFSHWRGDVDDPENEMTKLHVATDGALTLTAVFVREGDHRIELADANLEQAVRNAMNKPEWPIYASEAETLLELDAKGLGIESLEGIQDFKQLEELQIKRHAHGDSEDDSGWTYNYIEDIGPLAALENLRYLNLHNNPVSDLSPLSELAHLEYLFFDNTDVTDLAPLSSITSLKRLGFPGTRPDDLTPLSALTELEGLFIWDIGMSDISFVKGLESLKYLFFPDNQVSDITPLGDVPELLRLSFADNDVSDITPLQDSTMLELLVMQDNALTDISPVQNLIDLQHLNANNTSLTDVGPIENLTKLRHLNVANNSVSDLTALEDLIHLEFLNVGNNHVSDITPLVENDGLGPGDYAQMGQNYLDLSEGSDDMQNIEILLGRGVEVHYEPQHD